MNKIFLFIIKIIVILQNINALGMKRQKTANFGNKSSCFTCIFGKAPHCLAEGEGYLLVHQGYTYSSL